MGRNSKIALIALASLIATAVAGLLFAQERSAERTAAMDFQAEMQSLIGGESTLSDGAPSRNPHVRPYAAVIKASKWDSADVYVCWENGSESSQKAMEWTREAIEATWQRESGLRFLGWRACAKRNAGIRIRIDDVGPHVTAIGKFLNKEPNRMVLNFTF